MKLTPESRAACSAASDVVSSTLPQEPPIAQAPKLIAPTFMSVVPSRRYSIAAPFCTNRIGAPDANTVLRRVLAGRALTAGAGRAAAGGDFDRRPAPEAGAGGRPARRAAPRAATVDGRRRVRHRRDGRAAH